MEIIMKNVRIGLFIVALFSLICMLAPCALAQDGGEGGPCCYNVPSGITSFTTGAIQLVNSVPLSQLSVPAETPVLAQMSSSMAAFITGKATGMTFLAEARKLNYVG
jgi:hypothetical protein